MQIKKSLWGFYKMNLNSVISMTGSITSSIFMTIVYIFLFVMIGLLIYFIINYKNHKHTIILRKKTKGNTDIVFIDKYKEVKKKGVPEYIHLWKLNSNQPMPPASALDIRTDGKKFCEGWVSETGEIVWINAED